MTESVAFRRPAGRRLRLPVPLLLHADRQPADRAGPVGQRRLPVAGQPDRHNYIEINAAINLGRSLLNSGIFTGGVILGTLVFGVLAGYALARLQFRGRGVRCSA